MHHPFVEQVVQIVVETQPGAHLREHTEFDDRLEQLGGLLDGDFFAHRLTGTRRLLTRRTAPIRGASSTR